jgi:hypothetical protein
MNGIDFQTYGWLLHGKRSFLRQDDEKREGADE